MKKLLCAILGITLLTACEEINFACDAISANTAADLINENFDNFGGALELSNPKLIKSEPNHIYCRAQSNVNVKYINYELVRKSDGDIYIMVNPLSDMFDEAIDDAFDFSDFDW